MRKVFVLLYLMMLSLVMAEAPTKLTKVPFSKGVNLSVWFQRDSIEETQFTYYDKNTFANLKEMGVDVVRLPIHFENYSSKAPDYIISPLFFSYLDKVIDYAEEYKIYLILDNHSWSSSEKTASNVEKRLQKVWTQVANRYKDKSEYLLYEVLNEPHGISVEKWGKIQGKTIELIRKIDKKHTIVVGGADWNSYNTLQSLPDYKDKNLIYTYHFYDPMLFTHQGGSWTDYKNIKGVPFPAGKHAMPKVPASNRGTWIEKEMIEYEKTDFVKMLEERMQIAVDFAKKRNVPIFCGEFGVMMTYANNEDRVAWYKAVREILEKNNIAWAMWDYYDTFGLYNTRLGGVYPNDINFKLADALGFTPSKTFVRTPTLFPFYVNLKSRNINVYDSWGKGYYKINPENISNAENKDSCFEWGNFKRYESLNFTFVQKLNLSEIVNNGGYVEFKIKTNKKINIELRFMNTETKNSKPWRIVKAIENIPTDNQFHTVRFDLSAFNESGAWNNIDQKWYPSENIFDWAHISNLSFSSEAEPIKGTVIQVKDIVISK